MTSRPLRTSARQSALRQQEQEAELARQREQISFTNAKAEASHPLHELGSDSSSSRSLSPALSDSASLSSESGHGRGRGREDESEGDEGRERKRARDDRMQLQQEEEEDPTKPFSDPNFQSYWEIAFVYGFLLKFRLLLRQNSPLHEISMEALEEGLLSKTSNACIEEIHINLLSNLLNRKKAVDHGTWQRTFLDTLDAKQKSNELEYDFNPLRYYRDYYQVPPEDRIHLLKALVHWVLQDGPVVRSGIEEDNDFYVIEPFGADQAKRVYWYFGEGTLRLFRETKNPKKKSTGWETVASNLEEMKSLADSFEGTSSRAEKALQARLREEIIEPAEEKILQGQLRQERAEKRMLKLAQLHELASTRTTRTRSSNRLNQPKYTFDDDEEDFEEEEEEEYYTKSSSRRKNNDAVDGTTEQQAASSGSNIHYHPDNAIDSNENNISIVHENSLDQHDHHREGERSASVEAGSSGQSSVGHDSDTSILDALQRARVQDDDSFVVDDDDDRARVENGSYGLKEEEEEVDRTGKVRFNILDGLLSTPVMGTASAGGEAATTVSSISSTSTTAAAPHPAPAPHPPPLSTPPPIHAALPGTVLPSVAVPVLPVPVLPVPVPVPTAAPMSSVSILTEDIEMGSEDA